MRIYCNGRNRILKKPHALYHTMKWIEVAPNLFSNEEGFYQITVPEEFLSWDIHRDDLQKHYGLFLETIGDLFANGNSECSFTPEGYGHAHTLVLGHAISEHIKMYVLVQGMLDRILEFHPNPFQIALKVATEDYPVSGLEVDAFGYLSNGLRIKKNSLVSNEGEIWYEGESIWEALDMMLSLEN